MHFIFNIVVSVRSAVAMFQCLYAKDFGTFPTISISYTFISSVFISISSTFIQFVTLSQQHLSHMSLSLFLISFECDDLHSALVNPFHLYLYLIQRYFICLYLYFISFESDKFLSAFESTSKAGPDQPFSRPWAIWGTRPPLPGGKQYPPPPRARPLWRQTSLYWLLLLWQQPQRANFL